MREALAVRSDRDFMVTEPAPRSRSAARGAKLHSAQKPLARKSIAGQKLPQKSVLAFAISRPREIIALLFFTACAGAIAWNALALQKARHPAPLFTKGSSVAVAAKPVEAHPPSAPAPLLSAAIETPPTSVSAPSVTIPAPPKSPPRNAIGDLIRNGGEVPPTPAPARVAPPNVVTSVAKPATTDTIAEIIRMGGPVPVPPASVGKPEADALVFAGQKALAKLGYGVKVDGFYGPGTRQALETFERDRRLPVTGEFGQRTTKELAAQAGISIP